MTNLWVKTAMDLSVVYSKTGKGMRALAAKSRGLPSDVLRALSLIDGKSTISTILAQSDNLTEQELSLAFTQLENEGYIKVLKTSTPDHSWPEHETFSTMEVSEVSIEEFFKVENESEGKAQEGAETRARAEADRKAKAEVEAKAEAKARDEAVARAKAEAERKAREEAEARARAEAARKAREEEARARAEAERKAKEEAEARARAEADRKAKAEAEAERKAREEAEAKTRGEAVARAKAEAERKAGEEAEARARAEAARKAREEEARARAEAERKAKEEAETQARAEAERKAQAKAETQAKAEAKRKAREEVEAAKAERKAQKAAEAQVKARARTRPEVGHKASEETEAGRKAREEAEAPDEIEREKGVKIEARLENRINLAAIGKLLRVAGISVSAAILLLMVLLHVVNLGWFIPVEKLFSDKIGEPVTIGSVHSTLLPTPHLLLEDVSIGTAKDIKIAEIRVVPVLATLLDNTKTLKYIEVESLAIPVESVERAAKWLEAGRNLGKIRLGRIYLKSTRVAVHGFELTPFNADIALDKTDHFESAELKSTDDKISVKVTPRYDALQLNIAATAWQPPIGGRFVFDELNARATASRQGLQFNEIDGWFYEGKLKGTATVNWQNQWTVEGDFELSNANLASIAALFTSDIALAGRLDLKGTYSAQSNNLPTLLDKPSIKAGFSCLDGSIGGIDLVHQVLQGGGRGNGGEKSTRYTSLSGNMVLTGGRYQFRQIRLAGKQLSASGDVDMTANKTLSGNITAELAVKSRKFNAQLSLSGNLKQPQLK